MKSDAMGINPIQIPEQMAEDAKNGVRIEYDKHTGEAIYENPSQRKKHCESQGYYDRNGSFGDPQRGGRN